jgi:membrane associated rhomboid family serine protease
MFICPRCNTPLRKTGNRVGIFWLCPSCGGRAITVEVLRKVFSPQILNSLWQKARAGQGTKVRPCAACRRPMIQIPVVVAEESEFIDICTGCHFIWFDPSEFERFPKLRIPKPAYEALPAEARRELAMANLELLKQRQAAPDGRSQPDHWWEILLGLFGMPVEYNTAPLRQKPIATWTTALLIAVVSLTAMFNLQQTIADWGLIPAEFTRHFGLTFISSFFLHAGPIHLLGNLYFLLVFGDNTEDVLDRKKYLLLIILASAAGDIAHILCQPGSTIPCVGASGGISGILAYYCLRFPKARVGILFWFYAYIRWVRVPVSAMFVFWLLMQIVYAYLQTQGVSNIAAFAHLGGAFVGVLFWSLTRKAGFAGIEPNKLVPEY